MQSFERLVRMVQRGYERIAGSGAPSFAVQLPGADPAVFGRGDPAATVVCEAFAGKLPLARHRLVYATLGDRMGGEIHALALKTLTPAEAGQG